MKSTNRWFLWNQIASSLTSPGAWVRPWTLAMLQGIHRFDIVCRYPWHFLNFLVFMECVETGRISPKKFANLPEWLLGIAALPLRNSGCESWVEPGVMRTKALSKVSSMTWNALKKRHILQFLISNNQFYSHMAGIAALKVWYLPQIHMGVVEP